ncbi:transcription-repair-coupling factor [Novimethylophilus kurashikiensis]|uniref:Transcription-repair-coupling factor n=1 Tax=Novimethylophilus kurashikiensis TaxID=1825523 RepID=A0A2R5F842_9PROT|nr:HDOD domain-containing protein [Novimethylophilus kurashikiensis]GBG13073.1 transcription-repair-coupling factor [Novimethylophilus kurashikiensis]
MHSINQGTFHPRELSDQDIESVVNTIDIPACPTIVTEVLKESQRESPDIQKISKWISSDVSLAAATLKLANSPLFRAGVAISNIRTALERLGMRNVVCVVIAAALRNSMHKIAPSFIEEFWDRTAALATAAGMIAKRQYGVSPDIAYTYALFHDIGIPLMMKRFSDYEQLLNRCRETGQLLYTAENDFYPCTHPVIGYLLTRGWGLPAVVGQAIRFHHDPEVYDLPETIISSGATSLVAIAHIAEYIINTSESHVDVEVGDEMYQRALVHFGVDVEDLEQFREDLLAAMR